MSILPPNASALQKALEAAIAAPALPVPLRSIWNASTCPAALLPWLAWTMSVDNWSASWPLTVRRSVTANAIRVHRQKGTAAAVRRAISSFGADMSVREWWETDPPGPPGTFDVILSVAAVEGASPSPEFVNSVIAEIEQTKPLSRHFTFTQALAAEASIGLIGVVRPAIYARQSLSA